MDMKEAVIHTNSGAVRDVMRCLFFHGPTWDGNIPSKSARDGLCKLGLVERNYGYAWLTRDGVELAINIGLDREKERWERAKRPPYQDFR
jgi:hypothetical protein